MRLVTFSLGNVTHMGALLGEQIIDLPGAYADWRQANPDADLHFGNQQGFPENVLAFLQAGDIIATGTPSGVGFAHQPPVFLKPGDVVQIEISELGLLENSVVASVR